MDRKTVVGGDCHGTGWKLSSVSFRVYNHGGNYYCCSFFFIFTVYTHFHSVRRLYVSSLLLPLDGRGFVVVPLVIFRVFRFVFRDRCRSRQESETGRQFINRNPSAVGIILFLRRSGRLRKRRSCCLRRAARGKPVRKTTDHLHRRHHRRSSGNSDNGSCSFEFRSFTA